MAKFKFKPEDFECWVELSSKANFEDPIGTVSEKLADKANAILEAELKKCSRIIKYNEIIGWYESEKHDVKALSQNKTFATHQATLFNVEPLGDK